jgi:hypothetical protein
MPARLTAHCRYTSSTIERQINRVGNAIVYKREGINKVALTRSVRTYEDAQGGESNRCFPNALVVPDVYLSDASRHSDVARHLLGVGADAIGENLRLLASV